MTARLPIARGRDAAVLLRRTRGVGLSRDDDGLEFPDQTIAECEAAKAVAAIGSDLLPSGKVQEVSIEVRNETGQRLVAVSVSMRVERFDR